jgi:hypothetical protein
MSTTCPGCHKAIKIEDLVVKSYIPVVDLQTCGKIRITKRGRVAAQRIQCGDGIECEGTMEGSIESDGDVTLGPKALWKGKKLQSRALHIAPGAKLVGVVTVPWRRIEPKTPTTKKTTTKKTAATRKTTAKKTSTTRASAVTKAATTRKKTAKKASTRTATATKTTTRKTTRKKAAKTTTKKKTARTAKKAPAAKKTASRKTTAKKKKTT